MNVTDKPKCYVFVCIGCRKLAYSERSDAITCVPGAGAPERQHQVAARYCCSVGRTPGADSKGSGNQGASAGVGRRNQAWEAAHRR
jgi:hypothetical protein